MSYQACQSAILCSGTLIGSGRFHSPPTALVSPLVLRTTQFEYGMLCQARQSASLSWDTQMTSLLLHFRLIARANGRSGRSSAPLHPNQRVPQSLIPLKTPYPHSACSHKRLGVRNVPSSPALYVALAVSEHKVCRTKTTGGAAPPWNHPVPL